MTLVKEAYMPVKRSLALLVRRINTLYNITYGGEMASTKYGENSVQDCVSNTVKILKLYKCQRQR